MTRVFLPEMWDRRLSFTDEKENISIIDEKENTWMQPFVGPNEYRWWLRL